MRHRLPRVAVLLLLAIVSAVGGCAAEELIKRGDTMLAMGNAIEAEAAYLGAQVEKPKLAEDAEFVAKLQQARSRAAYQRGVQLGGNQRWEDAIAEFEQSIRIGPEAVDAPRALAEARREAAKVRHRRALELADQGKLNEAIVELRRARELDPENLDVQDALNSVEGKKEGRLQKAQQFYEQAVALQGERRWQQADERLADAIGANANHLPSRVKRRQGKRQLVEARQRRAAGKQAMADRRLDTAIASYEQALDLWPFFDEAQGELADARLQRRVAQEHYDRAVRLAAEQQWDEAVKAALASINVFPHARDAKALLTRSRREAALAHVRVGSAMLAEGKLEEAEAAFNRALGHQADMLAAKEGLAAADRVRGDEAVKKSLWGHALLWYTRANEHVAGHEFRMAIDNARARIAERIGFRLAVGTSGADRAARPNSADLVAAITNRLANEKPPYVELVAALPGVATDYIATVDLSRVDVAETRTDARNLSHRYTISRQVANPEIPRLQDRLETLRREHHRLRTDFRTRCPQCRGSGKRVHGQCRGTGRLAGQICPDCHGTGYRDCRYCHGSGRSSNVTERDLRRKRDEIDDVRDELNRTPQMVIVETAAEWPYVVETYEKRGTMVAVLRVTDAAGKIVHSDSVQGQSTSGDATIRGANPAIGLGDDPLQLPTDHAVRQTLLAATAKESAAQLVAAAVQQRIKAAQVRAEGLSAAGDDTQAVETYIDAALLAEPLDPKEAARVLTKLRDAVE
jgi:tetratricopeptide (TPR) repeat protein